MPMSPKTKKILKRVAIGFGIYVVVFWVGAGIYLLAVPGAWEKFQQSQSRSSPGLTMGIMAGVLDAQNGAVRPSDEQLDAMARKARRDLTTSPSPMFVEEFKQGYREGWRRGD